MTLHAVQIAHHAAGVLLAGTIQDGSLKVKEGRHHVGVGTIRSLIAYGEGPDEPFPGDLADHSKRVDSPVGDVLVADDTVPELVRVALHRRSPMGLTNYTTFVQVVNMQLRPRRAMSIDELRSAGSTLGMSPCTVSIHNVLMSGVGAAVPERDQVCLVIVMPPGGPHVPSVHLVPMVYVMFSGVAATRTADPGPQT